MGPCGLNSQIRSSSPRSRALAARSTAGADGTRRRPRRSQRRLEITAESSTPPRTPLTKKHDRSYYFLRVTKGNETRDRILETAFRLAARDGLEGLSIGKLAEELSLSKSGMFAHFTSKEELQI